MKPSTKLRSLRYFSILAFQLFSIFPLAAILDGNNNGMSDLWEKQHNNGSLFPTSFLSTADPDQDGWDNATEAIAGTDPFEPNPPDGIVVTQLEPSQTQGAYSLTWPTIVGKRYRVQASYDLGSWFSVGNSHFPTESILSIGISAVQPDTSEPAKIFWRIIVTDLDDDSDLMSNAEEHQLGTSPYSNDTDEDGLSDRWEVIHNMNPNDYYAPETNADPDNDGVSNQYEFILGTNPLLAEPYATTVDRDDDGMPDLWEAKTARYTWTDGEWAYIRQLDWEINDAQLDFDSDGLTNIAELGLETNPVLWDTDSDLLPDGWEVTNQLNPKSNAGDDGTHGDLDGDGLDNYDELTHKTKANNPDSDGDGTSDKQEVEQGSDPNKAGDGGQAPPAHELLEVPFRIGDPSESNSERWQMTIKGNGPDDTRTIDLVSPEFGQMGEKAFKLRKWNKYTITISHIATNSEDNKPDYDWEAQVERKPTTDAVEESEEFGWNNYFPVKNHWLVDNRKAILTTVKQGNEENVVAGKEAFLIPMEIGDNLIATGVDDVSVTADSTSPGYQKDFWIMAPQGGQHTTTTCISKFHSMILRCLLLPTLMQHLHLLVLV